MIGDVIAWILGAAAVAVLAAARERRRRKKKEYRSALLREFEGDASRAKEG